MSSLSLDVRSVEPRRQTVSSIMIHVVVSLLPGISVYSLLIDSHVWINLLIACLFAVVCESILVKLRGRPVLPAIKDASILLAAILLVLSVPQTLPLWQLLFGVFVLCTLGKHVFGGLGHNPFNPAMVAYAVLIISFPLTMTSWDSHRGILDVPTQATNHKTADGISGATPLDRLDILRREVISSATVTGTDALSVSEASLFSPASLIYKSDWVWINLAWLIGGLYLLIKRIISWHIPFSILTTVGLLYLIYGNTTSLLMLPATAALVSGAIMLGAFFIATDPVSAATSNPGKLVYGAGIGILCFHIREFSAYPEGVAFSVLLMNTCVPLIDHVFVRNRLTRSTDFSRHE